MKPYQVIDIEQGSPEWHELRRTKIGSSEAGAIMGLNPYKSANALRTQRLSGTQEICNVAMQRGKDLEPFARMAFEANTGILLKTEVCVSIDRPWQIASLDGMSLEEDCVVEIKCGSEKLHDMAKKGVIPPYYKAQIQHQLSVTGFNKAFYWSFNGSSGVSIQVDRDESFIERLNGLEEAFWMSLQEGSEEPTQTLPIIQNQEASDRLQRYLDNRQTIKDLETECRLDRDWLSQLGKGDSFILDQKKVFLTQTATYDTKAMITDGIDVSKYKKLSKPFWTIR